jgi:hypothetical protein
MWRSLRGEKRPSHLVLGMRVEVLLETDALTDGQGADGTHRVVHSVDWCPLGVSLGGRNSKIRLKCGESDSRLQTSHRHLGSRSESASGGESGSRDSICACVLIT